MKELHPADRARLDLICQMVVEQRIDPQQAGKVAIATEKTAANQPTGTTATDPVNSSE